MKITMSTSTYQKSNFNHFHVNNPRTINFQAHFSTDKHDKQTSVRPHKEMSHNIVAKRAHLGGIKIKNRIPILCKLTCQ